MSEQACAYQGIRDRLGDRVVSERGQQVEARCPAHDDRSPSLGLSVSRESDPGAVVHCQAGCSTTEIMQALGLNLAALFDRHWDQSNGNGGPRIVATYDYHDESGVLLYQVVRFEPKDFRQRRPNPDGSWAWKLNGVGRVLYRLPQVIEAVKAGQVIWIVEGERDVEALEAVGEVATCNPGGAGKWRSDYGEWLQGADVIVVADRDEPGRKHAETVRASLEGVAASVRVVEPVEGKDAADHLATGHGVDNFAPPAARGDDQETVRPGSTLKAQSFQSIRAERARWLWEGRIPLGTATLLVGREKLGKSTLAAELAAQLSLGTLNGELYGTPAATLLVSFEDSAPRTVKPRLLAAGADVTLVHRVFASRDGSEDLVSLPTHSDQLGALARETGARLLVIDPFSASLTSDIDGHRDQHIRRALAPLTAVAEREDMAIILVAHWNKAQGGDPLSRVLGSRGLTAAVRSVLAFGTGPECEEGSPDRVLAHAASNLAREAPSLSCRIEGRQVLDGDQILDTSRLVLGDEVDTSAQDLLRAREGDATPRTPAHELVADEIRGLAAQVTADDGWPPWQLADALGRPRHNQSFKAALAALLESEEWESIGSTRNRKVRPTTLGVLGDSRTPPKITQSEMPDLDTAKSPASTGDWSPNDNGGTLGGSRSPRPDHPKSNHCAAPLFSAAGQDPDPPPSDPPPGTLAYELERKYGGA